MEPSISRIVKFRTPRNLVRITRRASLYSAAVLSFLALVACGRKHYSNETPPTPDYRGSSHSTTATYVSPDHSTSNTLAAVCLPDNRDRWQSVSGLCHILLFYGLGPTDLPDYPTGESALAVLLDEETAIKHLGRSPFVRTRHGLRYQRKYDTIFATAVGEAHRDQCLATFASLGLSVQTPLRISDEHYHIGDLLTELIVNYNTDDKDLVWTAMALAGYLPPRNEWVNRFGESFNFSSLAETLMQRNLDYESCGGTHIVQAIVSIGNADKAFSILENSTRQRLAEYLETKVNALNQNQRVDGSWGDRWWVSGIPHDRARMSTDTRFLITAHVLDIVDTGKKERRLEESTRSAALAWLADVRHQPAIRDRASICPITHASRALMLH